MSIFSSVTLLWKGEEYIVPPDRVMGLIAVVEEEISIIELNRKNGAPLVKLSRAFSAALNYAGKVEAEENVYKTFFALSKDENTIPMVVNALLMMMVPPLEEGGDESAALKKQPAKAKKKPKAIAV